MTKNERKYLQDTEERLYNLLLRTERVMGYGSNEAVWTRAEWGMVYKIMDALHIPLKERDVRVL